MNLNLNLSKSTAKKYPFLLINPGQYRQNYANIPCGLAILAAIIEMNEIPVFVRDYTAQPFDMNSLISLISNNNITVIGFTFMTPQATWTYKLLKLLKEWFPNIIYICGGSHPTFMSQEALNAGFDFVFRKEAEQSLISFIELLVNNRLTPESVAKIRGISFLEGDKIISAGLPERIKELDKLPFPARHLFPFPQNYKPLIPLNPGHCAQFCSSRGCPEFCTFCSEPYRDGIYYRSPENLVDEIECVKKKFNISHFYINDEYFCHDNARAIAISELLIKRNINLSWIASFTRIDPVSLEMFQAMRRSGCLATTFGVESGDSDVRKAINKRGSLEQVLYAVRLVQKAKMIAGAFFVFGHQTETLEQAERTINFARRLNADINKFFINTPYPGSADYTYFKKHNLLLSNSWEDYQIQGKPVIRTKYLRTEDLLRLKKKAFIKVYTSPRWWIRQLVNLLRIKNIYLGIKTAQNIFLEAVSHALTPKNKSLRF